MDDLPAKTDVFEVEVVDDEVEVVFLFAVVELLEIVFDFVAVDAELLVFVEALAEDVGFIAVVIDGVADELGVGFVCAATLFCVDVALVEVLVEGAVEAVVVFDGLASVEVDVVVVVVALVDAVLFGVVDGVVDDVVVVVVVATVF